MDNVFPFVRMQGNGVSIFGIVNILEEINLFTSRNEKLHQIMMKLSIMASHLPF